MTKPASILLFLSILSSNLFAQIPSYPASFSEPFPLYEKALGDFNRPVTSSVEGVQEYFNQGFQMMYAFTKVDAARSFKQAQKLDPDCSMCFWGEAWAWGPYLNGKMQEAEAPRAYASIQKAQELAQKGTVTEKEADLITAMAIRYHETYEPETQAIRDTAYAKTMEQLSQKYPNDLDIGTFYAEALFLLEPRRGYRDIDDPDVQRIHRELERVLSLDITHPGACHLYIHATESTKRPDKALACAEYIGSAIPGASHINHMPSHTWSEVGMWGKSVQANIMAWHSDQKAETGEGFAIYPSHNLHMLAFAASMDGQSGVATQAGRDYTRLTGNTMYEMLTLIRFGRFDDVLDVEKIRAKPINDIQLGIWEFSIGYASLKKGDIDMAKNRHNTLKNLAESSTDVFRFHPADLLLGTLAYLLEGEIHWVEGDMKRAIAMFNTAVAFEDQLTYDEPEPLPFAARHWLGAAYIAADNFVEAERVYREALQDHPNNGWSYYGLLQALEGKGKQDRQINEVFEHSWARSDTWIRGSKF